MRIAGQAGFGVMDVVRDVYGSDLVESLNVQRSQPTHHRNRGCDGSLADAHCHRRLGAWQASLEPYIQNNLAVVDQLLRAVLRPGNVFLR